METRPTAPQPIPRPHVLIPNPSWARSHGLCRTAEAVTSFPPSFLTRKWLTHVYHVPIYQQIISPVFWDLVTGPISCELPNNVYNQLLMALCYSVITGPLVSVSAVPHLTYIWLRRSCTFPLLMASLQVRGGVGVPKSPLLDILCPFMVSVWDSYSKQDYRHLAYKGKKYVIWKDKLSPKAKDRSL